MKRTLALLLGLILLAAAATANEGMWLFESFPSAKVKAEYGFTPSQQWLDHVRLSSVRFNNGGSGSFVSPRGLTFTNQHVAQVCLAGLSTREHDYLQTGFYARSEAEERRCPDLELNVLESIEDVTAQVQGAAKPGMSTAEAGAAQRAEMSKIEKDCTTSTGLRCDVVTLYSGGMFHLYRYKKYTDVRLVFTPEFDIAFFGGDPDNFEFPRYDLDITFFRVYENGVPAHTPNYLHWSRTGIKDGDLVFVSGNPGSTGRLLTLSQLDFLRDVQYPWQLKTYRQRLAALKAYAAKSPENARRAQEDIFGLENAYKAITGYNSGLLDPSLMSSKRQEEQRLKAFALGKKYGDPWSAVDKAMAKQREIFLGLQYLERRAGFRGTLARFARELVRVAAEKTKPNGERLREYRDSALPSLEQSLFSTAPIYKDFETVVLSESLTELKQELAKDQTLQPLLTRIFGNRDPQELAAYLISNTRLDDVAVRKQLYQGGEAAIQASRDPLIELMRTMDPKAREIRKIYDDQIDAVERTQGATLAKIRFSQSGLSVPPDATFTLRLSYGAVKGYVEDGRGIVPAGTKVAPFTTVNGAFEHAAAHHNQPPYQLPSSWFASRSKLNLETPLNFVSTPDIIGGNSGSPVMNRDAELVGIIFDGNIQSLPWQFQYEDKVGRAVSVDARAIPEALRKIYNASALAEELTLGAAKESRAATAAH